MKSRLCIRVSLGKLYSVRAFWCTFTRDSRVQLTSVRTQPDANPMQRDSILIFYASVMSCVQLFSTRSSANIMYVPLLPDISAANMQYACLLPMLAASTFQPCISWMQPKVWKEPHVCGSQAYTRFHGILPIPVHSILTHTFRFEGEWVGAEEGENEFPQILWYCARLILQYWHVRPMSVWYFTLALNRNTISCCCWQQRRHQHQYDD